MTAAKGFVVPAGGGTHFDSPTPGRSFALKLLGRETGESRVPGGFVGRYCRVADPHLPSWTMAGTAETACHQRGDLDLRRQRDGVAGIA